MTLPEIILPKITLPFEVPVLLHPLTVHFLVAIPVVILLLEVMNLLMKKKAVGGVSFFLIVLTVLASAAAYITGLADGKEAFETLGDAAKSALSEHKLLGTYLLLASGVLLLLKLLAMTGNKFLKALYILSLIAFVVVIFKQGKEGGDLVYKHGLNVQQVKVLDDRVFDLEEELEEAKASLEKTPEVETKTVQEVTPETMPVKVEEQVDLPETVPSSGEVQSIETPTVDPQVPQAPLESTGIEQITTVTTPEVETVATEVQE
jgi:uncharacterized membrane protein